MSATDSVPPNAPPPLDEQAARLIEAQRPQLLAYIHRNLGTGLQCKVEAEDILQELTLDVLRRAAEIPTLERDLFGWLCQLAEYRIIDAHRHFFGAEKRDAAREVALDVRTPGRAEAGAAILDLLIASLTSPSQAFSRDQRQIALLAALEQLPAEAREALRLRYVEGLPTKEVATRLGKTDGAMRVLLTRIVQKLQGMLE